MPRPLTAGLNVVVLLAVLAVRDKLPGSRGVVVEFVFALLGDVR